MGNGSAGIQVVDPFHDEGPRATAHVPLSRRYPAGRVAAEGSVAYIAADQAGFVMIDAHTGEILVYSTFALTTGFTSVLPYLLPIWLCVLLPHRAWRDEQRNITGIDD